jgi:hypothetical protein
MTKAEAAATVRRLIEGMTELARAATITESANEDDLLVRIEWLRYMHDLMTGPSAARALRAIETDLVHDYPDLAPAFKLTRKEAVDAVLRHTDAAAEQLDLLRARTQLAREGLDPWDPKNRERLEDVWDGLMADRSLADPGPSVLHDDVMKELGLR